MKRLSIRLSAGLAIIALASAAGVYAQMSNVKGGSNISGAYEVVRGWPQNFCGEGYQPGSTAGIWSLSPDRIVIFTRGCLPAIDDDEYTLTPSRNTSGFDMSREDPERHPRWDHIITFVDRHGEMIESWEQHNDLFVRPHRVLVNPYDPEQHLWFVDDSAHAVYKFTQDGEHVQTIGTPKVAGNDESHFARPTDIAWLPDSSFFVTDGYTNTRVVKFDADGNYLMSFGERGETPDEMRPGYMNTVHAISIDQNRRLYISDRSNSRIQVFDEHGNFIEHWPDVFRPYSFLFTEDQHLWVSDGTTQKFSKFDLEGRLLHTFGTYGAMPGANWGVHQFHTDAEGNLYTADVHVGRAQKYRPKPGADPDHLIGRYFPVSDYGR